MPSFISILALHLNYLMVLHSSPGLVPAFHISGVDCYKCVPTTELRPAIPINSLIEHALDGLDACSRVIPRQIWTTAMIELYERRGRLPYVAVEAKREKGSIGTASFTCKRPNHDWTVQDWSAGPYRLRCPTEYWLVVVKLKDLFYRLKGPHPSSEISNGVICVPKATTAKQYVRGYGEADCLDYVHNAMRLVSVIAWATKDDGKIGAEGFGKFAVTRLDRNTVSEEYQYPTIEIEHLRTAFDMSPDLPTGTKLIVCFTNAQLYTAVFKLGFIDRLRN